MGRLSGVLDQIEEYLDQLILVAHGRRQGGIIIFAHSEPVGHAIGRQRPHPVQNLVDIDRRAGRERVIGKGFHPVDQPPDPVGLIDNQLGEWGVLGAGADLEELRRTTDPRKRVLDFMGQHSTQPDNGPQAASLSIAIPAQIGTPDMQSQKDRPVAKGGRCPVGLKRRQAKEADFNPPLTHSDTFVPRPGQERHQGRTGWQGCAEAALGQQREALAKEGFGRFIDRDKCPLPVNNQSGFGREVKGCCFQVIERGRL